MRSELMRLKRDTDSSRQIPVAISELAGSSPAIPAAHREQFRRSRGGKATQAGTRHWQCGCDPAGRGGRIWNLRDVLAQQAGSVPKLFRQQSDRRAGKATLVAISPDGKYLLHVMDDGGQQSLLLQNIPTNSTTQVVAPGPFEYVGLRFSPDGNYLYFVRFEPGSHSLKYLYRAPVLGGTPQKLVTDIDSNIALSPDGKKFAYILANNPKVGEYRIIVRSAEGSDEKVIATGPLNEVQFDLAWSPNGKTIVMALSQPGDALGGMAAFDAESGKRNDFLLSKDLYFSKQVWLPDGSGLLALGVPVFSSQVQIVHVAYPSGKVSAVTRDTNSYIDLSMAADGHTVAAVERLTHNNAYVMPAAGSSAQARQLPMEGPPSYEVGWTRDGQLLMSVANTGVTLLNSDSGAKTPLFSQIRFPGFAHSCPDGHLVFMALASSKIEAHIYRADADGGNVKELTSGKFDYMPTCSADSKSVFYADADAKLNKVAMEGGASQQFPGYPDFGRNTVSPDGKVVAIVTAQVADPKEKLGLLSPDFSQPIRLLEFERPRAEYGVMFGDGPILFTQDGKGIIYPVREGQTDNLWLQNLDGSPGKQLTDFKSEFIRDFDILLRRKTTRHHPRPPRGRCSSHSRRGEVSARSSGDWHSYANRIASPHDGSFKKGCRGSRAIRLLALNSATHPAMWIVCSSKCALSPASRSDCRSDKLLKIPFAL